MRKIKLFLSLLMLIAFSVGNVWAASPATLSFSAKCNGSGTDSDGNSWTITSDGTESNFDSDKGIHYGTGSAQVKYIRLSTSAITGTITQVKVNASAASGVSATVAVKVGTTDFTTGNPASTTASVTTSATDYTFTGSASGEILVEITKASKATKALYCKSVVVTYSSGGTVNVTSVELDESSITLGIDGEEQKTLTATVLPVDATNKNVSWESDDEDVATVEEGVVTAVGAGDAKITCKSVSDPTKFAECSVHVNPSPYSKSSLIFTAACGGSGTADDGAEWTVTSDANESNFDNARGIHYGTNSASVQYIQLSTSDISGTIAKVVVNASDATGTAEISVSVGGTDFTCGGSTTVTNSNPGMDYKFTGNASGEIIVRVDRGTAAVKAIYVKSVVVSYEAAPDEPAVTVNPTSVSVSADAVADGVIDATYTNIDETQISVVRYDDAECSVPFSGSWLTASLNGDKDIAYTLTENTGAARTAYIKLTAKASNGTSPDVVKVIPVTQAKGIPTYTTLNAIFTAATTSEETVKVTFNNWVISAVKNNNAYLTDGTYGLIIYTSSHGFNVGDVLSGTVQTTLTKYQGNAELLGLTSTSTGLTVTAGGTVTARVLDAEGAASLTGANAGSLIKISGECTEPTTGRYYINGIQLYNTLYSFETPTVGDVYDCTGIFVMYNSYKEILPRQNGDLVPSAIVPTAVITFEDFSIEKGQNTTLAATVAPAVAASAEVTYSIVDGGEYVSREGDVLTANEIGIAHIRATVADNLPNYYGATKDITVTVTAPDSRYKAEQTGFAAITGNLTTVTEGTHKDKQYISYEGKQGASSNVPAIYDTDKIRLYQNGGLLVIGAAKGCKIDQVFLTTGGTYNTTTIGYSTSELSIATSGDDVAKETEWHTATGLNTDTVVIVCLGTDKYSRIDVAKLDVRYTGDPISVKSIALSGTYQTEFTKNATFNHDGVVVTATYTDDSQADVTTLAEFSDPDMSTIGQKEITVSYGGESTSYNIEVVAATLTEIAISGTYPTRFNVDDAFSHAGMTVTATYSDFSEEDVTNDATFSGYNMAVGGIQTVTVEYGGQSALYSIIVVPANTDVITAADLEATSTQYKAFSGVTDLGTSAVYAGKTAKSAAGAIQVRTSANEDGIVVTAQNGTKVVKSVTIDFATVPTSPKVLQVYGKHTAYTSAADLFDDGAKGDLIGSLGEDGSVDCTAANYEFIGIRSSDGAMYLASVMVTWGDAVIPPTVYTVTFNTDGGSTIDPVEVEEGQAVAKPADPTKDDYNFVEWQLNGVAYDFTAAVTASITLDAVWEPVTPPVPDYETVRSGLEINRYYTVCLPKKVTAIKGASFWTLNNKSQDGATAYLEEETNNLPFAAGKPFIIQATAEKLEVVYEGAATEDAGTNGALHGTLVYMDATALAAAGSDVYMLFSNELRPVGENNHLDANRAYVKLSELNAVAEAPQGAPGKRVRAMPMQPQVATGIDALNASDAPAKVLINGQLFIIRGEKMFDAKGQLVK